VAERDGHLVIGHQSSGSHGTARNGCRYVRPPPVRAALDGARSPVRVSDLAAKLAADFPAAASDVIGRLVERLISLGFLITSLRIPMTAPDPLGALLAELGTGALPGDASAARLRAVSASLARHNCAASPAAARDARQRAAVLATSIRRAAGPALAIDLRLDWDLTLPESVAAEAARAAGVLARLARRPVLSTDGQRGMPASWSGTAPVRSSPSWTPPTTAQAWASPPATSAPGRPSRPAR